MSNYQIDNALSCAFAVLGAWCTRGLLDKGDHSWWLALGAGSVAINMFNVAMRKPA